LPSPFRRRALAAQAHWACLGLDLEEFLAWVAGREVSLDALHLEDLYLAWASSLGNAAALRIFDEQYIGRVASYLVLRSDDPFVEEVQQAARILLLVGSERRIASYSGRGSLDAWTRRVVVRLSGRLRRQGRAALAKRGQPEEPQHHPEMEYLATRYRADFSWALGEALRRLDRDSRRMLSLYFLKKLTVAEVGPLFGISAPTVTRRLAAIRGHVVAEMRTLLLERLRIDGDELDALLRLVRSRLDISFERLLASRSGASSRSRSV
jgi:RNA polymerase sigma-70 factor (ECF subfamily)